MQSTEARAESAPEASEPASSASRWWSALIAVAVLAAVVAGAYTLANAGDDASPIENARALIADTAAELERYRDLAAAEADGFVPLDSGLPPGTYQHLMHTERIADAVALDPEQIESLVYFIEDDGTHTLVSGMYMLPPDQTIADAPASLGDLAVWHDHSGQCWDENDVGRFTGEASSGQCDPPGVLIRYAMLHVWVVDNTCGPFASLPGHGNVGAVCHHDHVGNDVEGLTVDELAEAEASDIDR